MVWYWTGGRGLDTIFFTSVPDLTDIGYAVSDITPVTVPSWLQVDAVDIPATQLYIWPFTSGDPVVDTSPPPLGTGYDIGAGLNLRTLSGAVQTLAALTSIDVYWS